MRGIAILTLFAAAGGACAGWAQDTAELFNRAPKSIDDALRARINEFYELHVKADFRRAEALVAEDTKDYFYNHDKPQYLGFEINRIEYSDGYTKAKATVSVEQRVLFPGFNGRVMKIPTPSYWKIEDGKWYWYIDQAKLNETPFGVMKAGPPAPDDASPTAVMATLPGTPEELMSMVRVDKSALTLSPGESAQVVVENALTGPVSLSIEGKLEGIEARFDSPTAPAKGKATLTVRAVDGAKPGTLTVMASPLGKAMPIKISVR